MNVNGLNETLLRFFKNQMRGVHTIKIGLIKSVDHQNNCLDAKILSDTHYANGVNMAQPDVSEVPFFILSGSKGDAKITMPLAAGDLVLVLFSDRDYETFLDSSGDKLVPSKNTKTHDYNPILALPCFFTKPSATDVSDTDIVVSNKNSKITIKPDGDIDIESNGDVNVTCGSANITADETTISGNLTVLGDTTLGANVTSAGINIGSTHVHGGVTSGGSTTAVPQ